MANEESHAGPRLRESPADIERTILGVLGTLLNRDDLGVHESFFDLGADSQLIVQARERLSAALGHELADVDLFTYPNVAALVSYLTQGSEVSASTEGASRAQQRLARMAGRRVRPTRP